MPHTEDPGVAAIDGGAEPSRYFPGGMFRYPQTDEQERRIEAWTELRVHNVVLWRLCLARNKVRAAIGVRIKQPRGEGEARGLVRACISRARQSLDEAEAALDEEESTDASLQRGRDGSARQSAEDVGQSGEGEAGSSQESRGAGPPGESAGDVSSRA